MPRHWLFKSEPSAYSYDDLEREGRAEWDGVRNFQARNLLRDQIKVGDLVLFYHSSTEPAAVVGVAKVVRAGYPDHTAWDLHSEHPDPKSTPTNPLWYMVDIRPVERLKTPVELGLLRTVPALRAMLLLKRGVRLSVQPVAPDEFDTIVKMGSGVKIGKAQVKSTALSAGSEQAAELRPADARAARRRA